MKQPIIIGSRGSDLALWQANFVQQMLSDLGVRSEIKIIKTQGDKIQHLSFDKMEGKGFFTKEIESALISGEVDLAVHSHKDLETTPPPGLVIAAVSDRANPNEYLLIHHHAYDPLQELALKKNAVVGTSAARRKAQLLNQRPDLELKDLRGNVPTRIDKLRKGDYDAILVARAGVDRLGIDLSEFVVEELDPRYFVPAPAQGVLAFQVRENDAELRELLGSVNHELIAEEIENERGVLRLMDGGCQVPFGAYGVKTNDRVHYWSFHAARDGSSCRRIFLDIPATEFSPEKVLNQLQGLKQEKVLITRKLKSGGIPKKMLQESGMYVTEQSFIKIVPEDVQQPDFKNINWIFFTSANAVAHFPYFDVVEDGTKWAAVGRGTLAALREKSIDPDFIGMGSPDEVGSVFRAELGSGRALIVCGKNGLRNVQKSLGDADFTECEVYSTVPDPLQVEGNFEILVFTSPSNVEAFLKENSIPSGAQLVSIGKSTAQSLQKHGYDSTISWESSEQALVDTIFGLTD